MRRSWASVTVGLLVIVVATVSYLLIRSTNERASGGEGYALWALFRDASGKACAACRSICSPGTARPSRRGTRRKRPASPDPC